MTLEQDHPGTELDRLRAECARLAQALVVPADDGYRHIDRHDATGETARAWQDIQWQINALAAHLAAAQHLLDRASLVRQRQPTRPADPTELDELLRGPCEVVLTSLTGAPPEVIRMPLPEVIASAREHHATVMAVTESVSAARASAIGQLAGISTRIADLGGRSGAVVVPETVLSGLRTDLAVLQTEAERDPLGAVPGSAWSQHRDRLATRLERVDAQLVEAEQLRDRLPDLVDELRMLIGRLDAEEAEARLAWRGLTTVPGESAAGPPEPRAGSLRARLRGLELRCRRAEWWAAADEADLPAALRADVAAAMAGAAQTRQAATTHRRRLAEFRVELRGRLEAFRHKAISLGRSEDLTLTDLYDDARRLLRAEPLDASAADQAVWRYQSAVNEETQP
ncbi:hypothetical protein GCM10027290_28960 [Micromonospora sonneratiae]